MHTLSLIVILPLLFGGGGLFLSGPVIGGIKLALIIFICLASFSRAVSAAAVAVPLNGCREMIAANKQTIPDRVDQRC